MSGLSYRKRIRGYFRRWIRFTWIFQVMAAGG